MQQYVDEFPIVDLVEHPTNPRLHDESLLDESLDAHGFYGAVLVQSSTSRLIAGHGRSRAARRAGRDTVPAIVLDVDDATAAQLLLIDNRSSDAATNDDELLVQLLDELEHERGTLDGTGWTHDELQQLVDDVTPAPLDDDEVRALDRSSEHSCPFCHARWVDTPDGVALLDEVDE